MIFKKRENTIKSVSLVIVVEERDLQDGEISSNLEFNRRTRTPAIVTPIQIWKGKK